MEGVILVILATFMWIWLVIVTLTMGTVFFVAVGYIVWEAWKWVTSKSFSRRSTNTIR